jgi:hypothetical protein
MQVLEETRPTDDELIASIEATHARIGRATEDRLLAWAETVSSYEVRLRGDVEMARTADEAALDTRTRWVQWWFNEGRFRLHADLPAADGAKVARALRGSLSGCRRCPASLTVPTCTSAGQTPSWRSRRPGSARTQIRIVPR